MKCRAFLVCIAGIICQLAHGQIVYKAIVNNFDPSIIAKVYDAAKNVKLEYGQQFALAMFYKEQDSTIANWISIGKPDHDIDSLNSQSPKIFYRLLSKDQMYAYVRNKGAGFAAIASESEMEYAKAEYKPDSVLANNLRRLINEKYSYIFEKYLMYGMDKEWAKKGIAETIKWYDLYNLYPAIYASKYITDYIAQLSSIKKIPDTTAKKIERTFYNSVRENKYVDWSKMLTDITRYYLPDTAIFSRLQYDKLNKEAKAMSEVDRVNMAYWHHVTRDAYDKLYGLIWQKNYNNNLLQYTYAVYHPRLSDSLIKLNSVRYDSMVNRALLLDGSLLNFSQFELALKYKEQLILTPALTDALLYHALYVSKWIDSVHTTEPFAYVDVSEYESKQLTSLLSEEQYSSLLAIKNLPTARTNAMTDWAEMKQRNITQGFEEAQTVDLVTRYYIARYSVQNRYAHDKVTQAEVLGTLDKNKPKALGILDQARWSPAAPKPKPVFNPQW